MRPPVLFVGDFAELDVAEERFVVVVLEGDEAERGDRSFGAALVLPGE